MATPRDMRLFAADCLRWSGETASASHRDLMKEIAKTWTDAAASTEQHVSGQKPEVRDLALFDRALDRLFAALRLKATDLSGQRPGAAIPSNSTGRGPS
jgi:hypothetical protein